MSSNSKSLDAAIAATRFGLGARPGEIAEAASDPRGWLAAQIRPEGADVFPGRSVQQAGEDVHTFRENVKALQAEYNRGGKGAVPRPTPISGPGPAAMMVAAPGAATPGASPSTAMTAAMAGAAPAAGLAGAAPPLDDFQVRRRALYQSINQESQAEILARAQLACATPAGFRERWALFWSNHFTTSAKNEEMRILAPVFEREAIRPNVFGRFETLLVASSTHPGMVAYLDQQQSVGPNSVQIQRAALRSGPRAKQGLNENLAREIMELHTVGADGGYTQADVTEFARALTGLGIAAGQPADGATPLGTAVFREPRHEPGLRTVMGRRYGQDDGLAQAKAILVDLAARPQTARRLCAKIATHFVSDTPDPRLVARLEDAWRRSNGDLSQVALALVRAPEAWIPQPLKLKTPYELIVSSYRAAGATPQNVQREVLGPLATFGHRPFEAPQPNGWPDQASAWAAPDSLVKRLTWAQGFSGSHAPTGDVVAFAQEALGPRLMPATALGLTRAESRPEALALLIMSPEFQRR